MRLGVLLIVFLPAFAVGAYEPPDPAYAPPATYYNNATGAGTTLKTNLRTIVTGGGFQQPTYEQLKTVLPVTDRDSNNPSNIILIYNRASVSNVWNPNVSWNREHIWPDSKLGDGHNDPSDNYRGPASDLFNLRPANTVINGQRGSLNFGQTSTTGTYGPSGSYWFPGDADKGDVARSMFYMATAYSTLTLVNGNASADAQLGDLASLLKWHYTDGVDNFERRRNDVVYDTYQHNRNPYIDHPEYVWAVFGVPSGGNNSSQLSVATPITGGASTVGAPLGSIIVGASFGTQTTTLSKTGTTPTTFDVTTGGNANLVASGNNLAAGVGQTFDYNNQSRNVVVGLTSIGTPGAKTGTVTIDNTDLTTAAAGQGSADGNDTINVTGTVLNHANASFAAADQNSLTINFGAFDALSGVQQTPFSIHNLTTTQNFTAPLDLVSVSAGSTSPLSTNLAPFTNLAETQSLEFAANFNTDSPGDFSKTFTLNLSDRVTIAGATTQQLTLTLTGSVLPLVLGDFDGDRQRDADDIIAMLRALSDLEAYRATRHFSPEQLAAIGDFTGDHLVSNLDIQGLLNSLANVTPVPEPATLLMFATAAGCLLLRYRRL